jgi:ABC-type branched-subunit amino acid transport system substrate-binding protein
MKIRRALSATALDNAYCRVLSVPHYIPKPSNFACAQAEVNSWAIMCQARKRRLIILAIQTKGLNRPAIRQALSELKDYKGVTGRIQWDNSGGNRANPVIIKEEKAVKSKNSGL